MNVYTTAYYYLGTYFLTVPEAKSNCPCLRMQQLISKRLLFFPQNDAMGCSRERNEDLC
jgi:hypothetical protein